jgi:hypothetical protein
MKIKQYLEFSTLRTPVLHPQQDQPAVHEMMKFLLKITMIHTKKHDFA